MTKEELEEIKKLKELSNKDSFYPEEFYTDDRVTARVNSGEAVLTAAQQRNLMALANGERGGSGTQINVTNNAKSIIKDLLVYIKIVVMTTTATTFTKRKIL